MDEKTDIEKLEHFLTALKDAEVIDSSSTDTTVQDRSTLVEPAQSSNESIQLVSTKRKKPESSESNESNAHIKKQKMKMVQKSLLINDFLFKSLTKLEDDVTQLILDCTKQKALLAHQMENLKTPGTKLHREPDLIYKAYVMSLHKFSASPYFKDVQGYWAPHNDDFLERKKLMFLNSFDVIRKKPWDNDQKRALEKGILAMELGRERNAGQNNSENTTKKMGSRHSLQKRCLKMDDPQKVKRHLIEIVGSTESEYDWLKLSALWLNGIRSAHECRAIWFNYLHPKFRKIPWTELESDTLKIIAERYGFQNWEKITENLGTRRSAYQCVGYYTITLQDVTNLPWTEKEFKRLNLFVQTFKFGHHICWHKLASLMDGRTGVECGKKWQTHYSDIKKGKFSREEDILLVAGLRKFGPKWSEIAEYLPNRHALQVRGRLHVLKGRELAKSPWTPDDDDLLQNLLEKYGFGNWSKMCQHFLNRTPAQVRSRCRSLIRYKDKKAAGEYARKLGQYQRARSDQRDVEDLWRAAVRLIEKDSGQSSYVGYDDQNAAVMEKLSSLLHLTHKRGRRIGQINDSSLKTLFHNFFFVSYGQKGGRGKYKCSENMVPTMAYHLIIALQFLEAELYFPSESQVVMEDPILPEMDKTIACYFIKRKEGMQSYSTVVNFVDVKNVRYVSGAQTSSAASEPGGLQDREKVWKYGKFCPPSFPSLLAIRTMLLNKFNLKSQRNGLTVQKEISNTDPSEWNPSVAPSCSGEITSPDVLCVSAGPSIITISPGGKVSCYGSKPVQGDTDSQSRVATTTCNTTRSSVKSLPCIAEATTSYEPQTTSVRKSPVESLLIASSSSSSSSTTSVLPITSVALCSPVVVTTHVSPMSSNASSSAPIVVPSNPSQRSAKSMPPIISIPSSLQSYQLTNFNAAASLFRKRMKMLFGWSGLISTFYPCSVSVADEHLVEEEGVITELEDNASGVSLAKQPKKRGRKRKWRRKKENADEKEGKVKRQYVKSGKYVSDPRPTEASRKSSRIPKKKLA